jgi:hypothetical protein
MPWFDELTTNGIYNPLVLSPSKDACHFLITH